MGFGPLGLALEILIRRHCATNVLGEKSNRAQGKLLLRREWKVCSQLPGMAAGENEGQVVKPAPAGKVSILMIIVVVLIITVIVDRPLEVLESPGYVPGRRCVREAEVDALIDANVDYILGCVRSAGVLDGQSIGTRQ